MSNNYRVLKSTEIAQLREEITAQQSGVCPLCGKPLSNPVLDHQHKLRKSQDIGDDGAGLVRGVLCRECNVLEGKIWNAMNRYLQPENKAARAAWLRRYIQYLEKDQYPLVHPTERPEPIKVSKRQYNRLSKLTPVPEFPKSGKLTKRLKYLFDKYHISPVCCHD